MTVKDLIEKLKDFPQDASIKIDAHCNFEYFIFDLDKSIGEYISKSNCLWICLTEQGFTPTK